VPNVEIISSSNEASAAPIATDAPSNSVNRTSKDHKKHTMEIGKEKMRVTWRDKKNKGEPGTDLTFPLGLVQFLC
jgi:hypothetical protein